MVTALRSGPPPIPPSQPGRAAEGLRLPDFARGLARMEGPAAPGRANPQPPEALQAPLRVAGTETPDASRQARPARPGSILDIRI